MVLTTSFKQVLLKIKIRIASFRKTKAISIESLDVFVDQC